ncbi:MAG: cytochrome P450 [Caldilineaceae bacterium]
MEESLRMEPSVNLVDRYATCDVQMGDALIKEGELVHVALSGGNRGPAIFPGRTADRNCCARTSPLPRGRMSVWVCIKRLEAVHAIEQIVTKLPNLRLLPSADALAAATPRGFVFRKPMALYAVWDWDA